MHIQARGTALEVDVQGPPDGPPLLLVMGLAMQLTGWPQGFVDRLVARGLRVIRFDNRDAGLSQGFDALGTPNLALVSLRHGLRLPVRAPYTLADMAGDACGVLDALGVGRAHVIGASMGGMIAQQMAMREPQRLASLGLWMTSSGARALPLPEPVVRMALLRRPPPARQRERLQAHMVRLYSLLGSPPPATPPDWLEGEVRAALARAYRPRGTVRQLTAVLADADRTPALARLRLPTHVVHGAADPLLPPAHARQLASAIPGATLTLVPGMGHDLGPGLWGPLADAVLAQVASADRVAPTDAR